MNMLIILCIAAV